MELVGTAKAASKLAGGTYVPRDEWDAIQKKLKSLEEQLAELQVISLADVSFSILREVSVRTSIEEVFDVKFDKDG